MVFSLWSLFLQRGNDMPSYRGNRVLNYSDKLRFAIITELKIGHPYIIWYDHSFVYNLMEEKNEKNY
jgi:hypothetical protein